MTYLHLYVFGQILLMFCNCNGLIVQIKENHANCTSPILQIYKLHYNNFGSTTYLILNTTSDQLQSNFVMEIHSEVPLLLSNQYFSGPSLKISRFFYPEKRFGVLVVCDYIDECQFWINNQLEKFIFSPRSKFLIYVVKDYFGTELTLEEELRKFWDLNIVNLVAVFRWMNNCHVLSYNPFVEKFLQNLSYRYE